MPRASKDPESDLHKLRDESLEAETFMGRPCERCVNAAVTWGAVGEGCVTGRGIQGAGEGYRRGKWDPWSCGAALLWWNLHMEMGVRPVLR